MIKTGKSNFLLIMAVKLEDKVLKRDKYEVMVEPQIVKSWIFLKISCTPQVLLKSLQGLWPYFPGFGESLEPWSLGLAKIYLHKPTKIHTILSYYLLGFVSPWCRGTRLHTIHTNYWPMWTNLALEQCLHNNNRIRIHFPLSNSWKVCSYKGFSAVHVVPLLNQAQIDYYDFHSSLIGVGFHTVSITTFKRNKCRWNISVDHPEKY